MIYEKDPANFDRVLAWQPDMVNLDQADLFIATMKRQIAGTSEHLIDGPRP